MILVFSSEGGQPHVDMKAICGDKFHMVQSDGIEIAVVIKANNAELGT